MIRKRVSRLSAISCDQAAEAVDIGVVQRRVDLVEHADRRGIGEEDGEEQRERGQRLLAAREQRQHLELLARRARHDLEPGLERVFALAVIEPQMGVAAAEEPHEQLAEMLVDLGEGGRAGARAPRGSRRRCPGAAARWRRSDRRARG